jgi:hypothetical protein
MDTDARARLEAHCTRLEHELVAIERVLENCTLAVGDAERLQLAASQESHLAELGGINAQLSALRDSAAPT